MLLALMAAFQSTVRTAVRGYHVYREVWVRTIDEEFDCWQEAANREDRHAVAVYGGIHAEGYMHVQGLDTFFVKFRMYPSRSRSTTVEPRVDNQKFVTISIHLNRSFSPDRL